MVQHFLEGASYPKRLAQDAAEFGIQEVINIRLDAALAPMARRPHQHTGAKQALDLLRGIAPPRSGHGQQVLKGLGPLGVRKGGDQHAVHTGSEQDAGGAHDTSCVDIAPLFRYFRRIHNK